MSTTHANRLVLIGLTAILWALPFSWVVAADSAEELVDYVNPLIGTDGLGTQYGGMVPGVTHPFGMTQWLPMTRKNEISRCPYNYHDSFIQGFIGSHQPAIWMGDYGQVSMMPGVGSVVVEWDKRKQVFFHADEISTPYYYAVTMNKGSATSIKAELSATARAAILAFTFPAKGIPGKSEPYLVIDASQE